VPTTSTSLTRGTTTRTLPVQEMVIALEPDEVAPFMEALSVEAQITCLARSGRPDDPVDSLTPSSEPDLMLWGTGLAAGGNSLVPSAGSMAVIESISDRERTLVPVPDATAGSRPR